MSRFLSPSMQKIAPYVPGEQPKDHQYIKLNTNECPYPPSPGVERAVRTFPVELLRLYPEIADTSLCQEMAKAEGLTPAQVFAGGGSDEVLGYAFMAFFEKGEKVYYPNVTYGFYQVYADLMGLNGIEIPLRKDFTIDPEDYYGLDGHIFIANPNAPTGICLKLEEVEGILQNNPNRLVVVDEAYIDFAREESSVKLIDRYDNLLVIQTFSKSRSLAGMRIGFGFGHKELISGLERAKFCFNPYNMDRISIEVGKAAIKDRSYMEEIVGKIVTTRSQTAEKLKALGFQVLPSQTNFLFARKPGRDGAELYQLLRNQGILVRHFSKEGIQDFLRISIGTDAEMDRLLAALEEIA